MKYNPTILEYVQRVNIKQRNHLITGSPISAIMSYISVNARMTTSIYLALYGNKVLVELKRAVEDIWNS